MSKDPHLGHQSERSPVVVRDVRRIDPVVLQSRRRQDVSGPDGVGQGRPDSDRADAARLREQIAELTEDLQRVKAEYDNYRKRVRRDRLAVREIAVVNVLTGLLPVLDVVEAARRQGDCHGAAAVLCDVLEEQLAALGLRTVGAAGEPFDPNTHEAIDYRASGTDKKPCAPRCYATATGSATTSCARPRWRWQDPPCRMAPHEAVPEAGSAIASYGSSGMRCTWPTVWGANLLGTTIELSDDEFMSSPGDAAHPDPAESPQAMWSFPGPRVCGVSLVGGSPACRRPCRSGVHRRRRSRADGRTR